MSASEEALGERVRSALFLALDFLEKTQLSSGEFKTFRFKDPGMESHRQLKSTPYGTSYVLYSLSFAEDSRVAGMVDRAIAFLVAQMESPGLWRYFSRGSSETLPPDLDDTACAAFLLLEKHDFMRLGLNHRLFLLNRDAQGRFLTFLTDSGLHNVCGLVNANVLLYLGQREETLAACDYLVSLAIHGPEGKRSIYGAGDLVFYYALSRAYFHGVASLGAARQATIDWIIARRCEDGALGGNELDTAIAVSSLINFCGDRPEAVRDAVTYLLNRQQADGSWPRAPLYIDSDDGFYGSEEVTTALCVEALSRFSRGPAVEARRILSAKAEGGCIDLQLAPPVK